MSRQRVKPHKRSRHDRADAEVKLRDDEDIDDELAFDTDDEERFGTFFSRIRDSQAEAGGAVSADNDKEDLLEDDDLDLADLITSQGKRKKRAQEAPRRKVKSARSRVTSQAESLFVSRAPKAATAAPSLKQLVHTVAGSGRRLERLVAPSSSAVIPQEVPPEAKQRAERAEVRKAVEAEMKKWRPAVRELRRAKHVEFPLKSAGEQGAVPSTLGAVAAVAEQKLRRAGKDLHNGPTSLATQIDEALRASGLKIIQKKKKASAKASATEKELPSYVEFPSGPVEDTQQQSVSSARGYVRKLRAMLGSELAKRKRFNKIRSKAYRRILRKEREHEQQRRQRAAALHNPEAAQRRLSAKMEKIRAEERITQRHKNVSRWVRHAKKYAKFDDGVREAIGDQALLHQRLLEQMQEPADEEGKQRDIETTSEEEDRCVDELLDASQREAGQVKESSLWLPTQGRGTSTDQPVTPMEKARAELHGLGFMKRAAERHEAEMQRQWNELKEDVDRHQKGLAPKNAAPNADADSEQEELERLHRDDMRELRRIAKHHSVVKKMVEVSEAKNLAGKTAKAAPLRSVTAGGSNTAVANIAENRPKGFVAEQQAQPQGQPQLPSSAPGAPTALLQSISPSRGRKRARGTEEIQMPQPQQPPPQRPEQEGLVAQAFAGDEEDEFAAFKTSQVEAIAKPQDPNASLPGWGEWGGNAPVLNRLHRERVAKMNLEHKIETTALMRSRIDANLKDVVINHDVDLVPSKYTVSMVPRPFIEAKEFHRSLRQPLGPEWNTSATFRDGVAPRVDTVVGVVIDPLDRRTGRRLVPKTRLRASSRKS